MKRKKTGICGTTRDKSSPNEKKNTEKIGEKIFEKKKEKLTMILRPRKKWAPNEKQRKQKARIGLCRI